MDSWPPEGDSFMGACALARHASDRGTRSRVHPVEGMGFDPTVTIMNVNLHEEPTKRTNIGLYFRLCMQSTGLGVTTSCFSVWKRHKRTNGYAKVIPVVRAGQITDPVCVFFFDDNLEWDGTEGAQGICNLRDASSGEFVDFSEGSNGFVRDHWARHTVIHHSSLYRAVLVKANILDAISSEDYFRGIIGKYARPEEKLLVFMDVNSTIMCNDTSTGKDLHASLLSSMFELIEVSPFGSLELAWETNEPIILARSTTLKNLVKMLTDNNKESYSGFWREDNCRRLLDTLASRADIRWLSRADPQPVNAEGFCGDFRKYLKDFFDRVTESGITRSWFHCYDSLRHGSNAVVLNSFGVDTRKVVLSTVPDERRVRQITVNFELWEDGDRHKFKAQYSKLVSEAPATFPVNFPALELENCLLETRSSDSKAQSARRVPSPINASRPSGLRRRRFTCRPRMQVETLE